MYDIELGGSLGLSRQGFLGYSQDIFPVIFDIITHQIFPPSSTMCNHQRKKRRGFIYNGDDAPKAAFHKQGWNREICIF